MSKSSGIIIGLPLLLLALLLQVYSLWGWLARDGWIQYFLMAEVYLLIVISFLYLRSIYRMNNLLVGSITLLLVPTFYFIFRTQEEGVGAMLNSLWYINILISVIASAWVVVFCVGSFFLLRELPKQKLQKKTFMVMGALLFISTLMTYFIVKSQIPHDMLVAIWKVDTLRTLWFVLEPMLVLFFSLGSIYFYLVGKNVEKLKKEYTFIGLLVLSIGFEYLINGIGLVSLRSILYFLGLYSFINLVQNKNLVNYFLVSIFIILVVLHLNHYSSAPNFLSLKIFIPLLHNALIESMKLFLVVYIFIMGWNHVKDNKVEFRSIMLLIPLIAYTYTTQSGGNGVHLYDIVAITAMLKLTVAFLIIVYSFYFLRKSQPLEVENKQ